jgi:hypothetical protein
MKWVPKQRKRKYGKVVTLGNVEVDKKGREVGIGNGWGGEGGPEIG